jgi:hypothetical protein
MILNSPFITGSITVTDNVVASGSLTVLGTINGAVTGSVDSASYAAFAATANSASYALTSTSGSYAFAATSASQASNANTATSSSFANTATSASQASNANTATSASQATNAVTSSYAANADLLDGIDSTRFAVTSSNTFTGTQYISAANNAISFTSTASIYSDGGLRVTKDAYVSGTMFVNNLTVFGTQSINYITSSQLNIGTNIITVNTDVPAIRFGGLAVYDSGSTELTGSMLWDSEDNHWVYSNPSGSSYDGGMMLSGPRNSSGLGNEQGVNNNAILKGQGGDHVTSSLITETGTATTFYTNALYVTSSNFVGVGTTSPAFTLDVNGTGRFSGNTTIGVAAAATNIKLIFNGVASKAAGIEFQQSGTPQWYIGNGIASEDNNFELYNSNGTMAMKIIKSTNAINFQGAATFSSTLRSGNIGINTAALANTALRVVQTVNDEWTAGFSNNNVSAYGVYIDHSSATSNTVAAFQVYTPSGTGLKMQNNGRLLLGTFTDSGFTLDVNGTGRFSTSVAIGAGTQAINSDAELTLREGVAFVGLDFQSARTSGNIGGLRFFNTNSTTDAIAQLLIEVDGKFNFYNNNNGTPRFTIASTGAATFSSSVTIEGNGSTIRSGNELRFNRADNAIYTRMYDAGSLAANGFTFDNTNGEGFHFKNGATTIMRMPSNGNVGIGTTAPTARLQISANAGVDVLNVAGYDLLKWDTGDILTFGGYKASQWNVLAFSTTGSERMRITSGGQVLIASTSSTWASTGRAVLEIGGSSSTNALIGLKMGTISGGYVFHTGTDMYIEQNQSFRLYCIAATGGVYLSANATSWTANSDERLKTINYSIDNAVEKLMSLRAVNFSWKSDSSNKENLGLIAQDVEKVFPQVIDKGSLPNTPSNPITDNTEYLGVRYTELVPVLVKAIQEQQAQIEELKQLINK